MKHLKRFNESPFFGSDWGSDSDDDINMFSHWDDDIIDDHNLQFNLNKKSIQEIIDNYQFSGDGFLPKALDILNSIKQNLSKEIFKTKLDNNVYQELKKLGFPISKTKQEMTITWSEE